MISNIINIPPPVATKTYAPVSHKEIHEAIMEETDKHSLTVANTILSPARDNKQLIGFYDIVSGDSELNFRLGFRNSYDKTMSVAFVAGTSVMICSNGMISGEMAFVRKHTGSVAKEVHAKIVDSINLFDTRLKLMSQHKDAMKQIHVDKTAAAELCGRMFIEQDIITSTQLGIIKNELEKPTYDYNSPESLWELYNHTTHALKKAHPLHGIQQHITFHEFIEEQFNL